MSDSSPRYRDGAFSLNFRKRVNENTPRTWSGRASRRVEKRNVGPTTIRWLVIRPEAFGRHSTNGRRLAPSAIFGSVRGSILENGNDIGQIEETEVITENRGESLDSP